MMAEILQEGRDGGDEYHEGDESGQYEDEEILNTWLGELNTLKKVGLINFNYNKNDNSHKSEALKR